MNTWSLESGSARRVVLLWDGGLRLTWAGEEDGEALAVQLWTADGSALTNVPDGFTWDDDLGVWSRWLDAAGELVTVVESLVAAHGVPAQAFLPWESFTSDEFVEAIGEAFGDGDTFEERLEELDGDVLEEALETLAEELDDDGPGVTAYLLLAAAVAGGARLPLSWGGAPLQVCLGDDFMPPASPNARFMRFVATMEELADWIVIWDECCGSCASGTYRMMRDSRGLPEGAPSLILFGQNAQYYFPPTGSVSYEVYQSNEAECELVALKAREAGLSAQLTGDGSVLIS